MILIKSSKLLTTRLERYDNRGSAHTNQLRIGRQHLLVGTLPKRERLEQCAIPGQGPERSGNNRVGAPVSIPTTDDLIRKTAASE